MRTLVEQTWDSVRAWLKNLGHLEWNRQPHTHTGRVGLHILMGGEEREENSWDLYPEHDAILIGTQDMLLSRALNRGYGMSRYRWPMHFGLLNNDALWVMDETQLMGVGVETSAQLDAFRERLGAWRAAPTWWMSATLDAARVQTVDQRALGREIAEISLPADESTKLAGRLNATKRLTQAPMFLDPTTKKNYARDLVRFVVEKAAADALTLVILNRVGRAQEAYRQLLKLKVPAEQIALIHSRFRRGDRKEHEQLLFGKGRRIVVATQAIEAGVDVSARVLITELAPWPSLVQRFGLVIATASARMARMFSGSTCSQGSARRTRFALRFRRVRRSPAADRAADRRQARHVALYRASAAASHSPCHPPVRSTRTLRHHT